MRREENLLVIGHFPFISFHFTPLDWGFLFDVRLWTATYLPTASGSKNPLHQRELNGN